MSNIDDNMKMEKQKNPIVIGALVIILVAVLGYSGYTLYNRLNSGDKGVAIVESTDVSGYLETTVSEAPKDASKKFTTFIEDNKDEQGAYVYQAKDNTYVLLSAGKIGEDNVGYTISYESPVIDEDAGGAKVVYHFSAYDADEHQQENDTEYVVLKLPKLENVTTIETTDTIVLE